MLAENADPKAERRSPAPRLSPACSLRCVTVEVSTGFRHLFVLPADASGRQLLQCIEAETGVSYRYNQAALCDGLLRTKLTDLAEGDGTLSNMPSYLNLCFPLKGGGEGDEEKPPAKKAHWEEEGQEEEEEEDDATSSSSTNSDSDTNVQRLFIANGYQSGPQSGYQSGSSSSGYPDNFSSPYLESNSPSSEEESSPQMSHRTPDPSSLATEASLYESSDGSTAGGPHVNNKYGGKTSSKMEMSSGLSDSGLLTLTTSDSDEEQNLPTDPMKWTCEDVLLWLDIMTKRVGISEVNKRFFSMGGIGVAFIPRHGFVRRLGSKGVLFYQDFHHRLKAARCRNS